MEAILLPVESSSWFESGNAANVTIEDNTFQDCTIGGMDRGVICFRTDEKNKNMALVILILNQIHSIILTI